MEPFYKRNATTRAGFTLWHSARASRSDGETFFYLYLYLAGRSSENPQSARGPARCKSGPAITWLVGVTFYCIIFQ